MSRSGFVTIAGRPNVGKSTLLNRMIGGKIAITSPRPQTTRNRILGVLNHEDTQIIFIDTPGIIKPKSKLTKSMVSAATSAGAQSDVLLYMADASRPDYEADEYALKRIGPGSETRILAINKTDLVKKNALLEQITRLNEIGQFHEVAPISAKTGDNIDELIKLITAALPEGPQFYPTDMITDQPERFIIGEIIREKAFYALQNELPYATAVVVENMEDRSENLTAVYALIIVERDSQKKIVIGKKGAMLKKIGSQARAELERRLGVQIYLDLHVKVKPKWTGDERAFSDFGYGSLK